MAEQIFKDQRRFNESGKKYGWKRHTDSKEKKVDWKITIGVK